MEQCYSFSSCVALIGAAIMALGVGIFADQLIVLFAGEDAEMREIGALCIQLQCLALPIHAWVAVVNMFCTGLGNAGGALLLSTARQGTCFIPILYPLAAIFGAYGIASVQAVADVLTMVMAVPLIISMKKKIRQAKMTMLQTET